MTISWDGQKLHIGCGDKRLDGWVNTDAIYRPGIDAVVEVPRDLETIPSASVEWIYWCHGPEHVYTDLLPSVMAGLRRILRQGGRLTVATIDLVGIWNNRFATHANGDAWNAALYGQTRSFDDHGLAHKQAFTRETLEEVFRVAGFVEIRQWQPEEYPEILAINDYATTCRLVTTHVEGHA